MYKIYLIDETSTPNSGASFGGSAPQGVYVMNRVEIGNIGAGFVFSKGYWLKYQGEFYEIQGYSYNPVYRKYVVNVLGNPPFGTYSGAWSVHIPINIVDEHILLDTEDIEIETDFAVSDISDISSRKDSITKSITLKGTDKNNQAFGHLYFQNRKSDATINNRLFFNYSPIRSVACKVFEDGLLILEGNLMVTEVDIDDRGQISYACTITGNLITLKSSLGDSLLTDLDLSDLQHQYEAQNIMDSWGGWTSNIQTQVGLSRTQRYNPLADTYSYVDYAAGSGYVYPFIDYGDKFKNDDLNVDYTYMKIQNYRPAVWAKEYLNRMFAQNGLTYEIKANSDFIDRFNHLIIPNSDESFTNSQTSNRAIYTASTSRTTSYNKAPDTTNMILAQPIRWDVQDNTYLTDWSAQYGDGSPTSNREHNLLIAKRGFTSDARIRATGTVSGNTGGTTDNIYVQLVKRDFTTSTLLEPNNFTVIAQQAFTVADGESKSWSVDFLAPETTYNVTDQLQVRVLIPLHGTLGSYFWSTVVVDTGELDISSDSTVAYTVNVEVYDYIVPKAPEGVKQFDFLKSIINMFNFYVYNEVDNPTHFIFECYDDYYALTGVDYVRQNSLDWTKKIDFSSGIKIVSNLDIPKSYTFTYKEDNDYYNASYKDKYDEVYGTLNFTDSLGISDEKSVELTFSASPQTSVGATGRVYPLFTESSDTLADKKMTSTNIRILYYNGLHAANYLWSSEDTFDASTGTWSYQVVFGSNFYPNVSMYWFDPVSRNTDTPFDNNGNITPLTALSSLLWNIPKEYYFLLNASYVTASNLYQEFYINQTTELTDLNLSTVECSATLNEVDISTLDLSVPIYINLGSNGFAYYKVLTVEYTNNKSLSNITLQKIII